MREEEKEQEDIGDFEEIVDETKKNVPVDPNQPVSPGRLYKPRQGQFIGIVTERLGGNRMSVKSTDNKIRNSRVPGRFRRKFWLRPGDAVIVQPWPDDDSKADIIYQYRKNEMFQLRKSGILDSIKNDF